MTMIIVLTVVLLAGLGVAVYAVMNADKDETNKEPVKPAAEPLKPAILADGPAPEHSNEGFSYKAALSHGWDMTRKYWQPLLLVAVIYLLFQVLGGVLEDQAGRHKMPRATVPVYRDRAQGDRFYKYLQENGYIDSAGFVQSKLLDMAAPPDLTLPPEFADKQNEINIFLNFYRYRLPFPKPVYYLFAFGLWLIGVLMMIGFTKVSLMGARDQKPSVAELFINWNSFVPYCLGYFCYGLAVAGGLILLIIPGIILMVMLQMFSYLIIDKGLGPIAALRRSRVITKGHRGRLFIFGLLLMLLNIAGFLCLVVGLFFTVWTSSIAMARVYDRLENDLLPPA
jgi:hypothetical protein